MVEVYRLILADGSWFKDRTYSKLSSARNAAAQLGGYGTANFAFRWSQPSIQKLEPIYLFVEGGIGFQVKLGWVNFE